MSESTTWLTPEAHRKAQEEYENLTTTGRTEIAERLAEARAHGDLRENADYDAVKNEQGLMEARIRQLRQLLDRAVVRAPEDNGTVQEGSIVTLQNQEGDVLEYVVASPENQVENYTQVSPSGPLGAALLGAAVGDEVSYQAPGGNFTFQVKEIRPYQG